MSALLVACGSLSALVSREVGCTAKRGMSVQPKGRFGAQPNGLQARDPNFFYRVAELGVYSHGAD